MRVQLLGGMILGSVPPETAPVLPRKAKLVLAVLALAGRQGISRAQLCSIFWPDRQVAQARSSLRQVLSAIRRTVSTSVRRPSRRGGGNKPGTTTSGSAPAGGTTSPAAQSASAVTPGRVE